MMRFNDSGLTLVEVLVAMILTSILAVGVFALTRTVISVMNQSVFTATSNANTSVLRRVLRQDVGRANLVFLPNTAQARTTGRWQACTDYWTDTTTSIKPLVTFIQTETWPERDLAWKAIGYDVRADSATSASIWRLQCTTSGDTTTTSAANSPVVYQVISRDRLQQNLPLPNAGAWTSAVRCLVQLDQSATDCPTNAPVLVSNTLMQQSLPSGTQSLAFSSGGSGSSSISGGLISFGVNTGGSVGVQAGMSIDPPSLSPQTAGNTYLAYVTALPDSSTVQARVLSDASAPRLNVVSPVKFGASTLLPVFRISDTTAQAGVPEAVAVGMQVRQSICVKSASWLLDTAKTTSTNVQTQVVDLANGVVTFGRSLSTYPTCASGYDWIVQMTTYSGLVFTMPSVSSNENTSPVPRSTFYATRSAA